MQRSCNFRPIKQLNVSVLGDVLARQLQITTHLAILSTARQHVHLNILKHISVFRCEALLIKDYL